MKKRMLLLLTGMVLSLSLFGCGDADKDYDDDDDEYEEESKSKKESKTEIEATVDELIESADGAQAGSVETSQAIEEVKEEPAKPAKDLSVQSMAGVWVTNKIDATDAFMQGFNSSAAEYSEYFKIDKFEIALRMELKEDGTYVMTMDPDTMTEAIEKLSVALKAGMGQYLEDSFRELADQNGMSYENLLSAYGVDSAAELLTKSTGQSLDELVDGLFDDLLVQMDETINESGEFRVDGNSVIITISGTEEVCYYDKANDTFIIEDNGNRGDSAFLFPMTFYRK